MDANNNINHTQTLKTAIEKLKNLEKGELPTSTYLDNFSSWLSNRVDDWEKNFLRIGLVGITSAGKSTFINALAGEDILPRGAQPTSGILVVCRKSNERKLKVLFTDKNEYNFENEECNSLWVKRYADEAENPNNEQNVQEMHLYLPKLMIPPKYDLIDSPGLDAFGLQGHEELTLRTLIPLVDVVLFLTTTKSTSDKENLKALAKICRESKPTIVVQTHKDAVEARYGRGGKVIETTEEVLEKHQNRVKNLLHQTIGLENAHIIQVSSIEALNMRLKSPDVDPTTMEKWGESGFGEVTGVLGKLHDKVSQQIAGKRLQLILNETQKLADRVKMDYFSARGKEKEASHFREQQKQRLNDLQNDIPVETDEGFPNLVELQQSIYKVKEDFLVSIEEWEDEKLDNLATAVRDKIKSVENVFFKQADAIEERLNAIALELSVDLQNISPEEAQTIPDMPQLKRYEQVVRVDVLEEAGASSKMKRWMGKLFKKDNWGYTEREVTENFVDREALKEGLLDYHSIYLVTLNNYLKTWSQSWFQNVGTILTVLAKKKDELNTSAADHDPEPYRILLNQLRTVRDWLDAALQHSGKQHTMGFSALKYKKRRKTLEMATTRTLHYTKLALPILRACRTLIFNHKTYRFWHVSREICPEKKEHKVLISTPFSQEMANYLTMVGDLALDENDLYSSIIVYGCGLAVPTSLPIKHVSSDSNDHRENWFLEKTKVIIVHDKIFESEDAVETFSQIVNQVDVIWRAVDFHQIGHECTRLDNLPIKDILESNKNKLAYIGFGAGRLLKGGQFIDAFKSYQRLKKSPGYGLRPFVLGDGEELLTSLLWLANSLGDKESVSDELKALEILTRTQPRLISGREGFIRNFFKDVKQFSSEQKSLDNFSL
ncbi:dynamin family protein [Candidatus Uabimicrobium sp. HlEnr_7]|uniref:dynamin family protein n=1 Tax=Candidatus Uabimicrobium helgolandensis TaxID=3095367 RepID=UPI003557BAE3